MTFEPTPLYTFCTNWCPGIFVVCLIVYILLSKPYKVRTVVHDWNDVPDGKVKVYGYKRLKYYNGAYTSPMYPATWKNGTLVSDHAPRERGQHGIYLCKDRNDPQLMEYSGELVYCEGSGVIAEYDNCYVVQKAKIIG